MCWSETASVSMVGIGAAATAWTIYRGRRWSVPTAFAYFTVMEALQAAGYLVIDDCGSPANQSLTVLSYLHIVFQPFVINAFVMELIPEERRRKIAAWVYSACALSAAVMLMQLYPFDWAGPCEPGSIMCGAELCLISGDWHLGWHLPYNGMLRPLSDWLNTSFPTYMIVVFLIPAIYGAWRFALFHLLVGPVLAGMLTTNPSEMPAIWCLFSIFLVLVGTCPVLAAWFSSGKWDPGATAVRD